MGRMKDLWMEQEELVAKTELSLDFELYDYNENTWWGYQDAEMVEAEKKDRMEALEIEAEIFELRTSGQM